MEVTSKQTYLEDIDFTSNGHMLVAASSLTRRYWTGSLGYYSDYSLAPNVEKSKFVSYFEQGVTKVKYINNTRSVVIGTDAGSVELWNIGNNGFLCLAEPQEHDSDVTSLSTNADDTMVVSSGRDRRIKVWSVKEFSSMHTYTGHWGCVNCVSCNPISLSTFASCSQDGRSILWDLRNTKPASLLGQLCIDSSPTSVAWVPDNEYYLVIGTERGEIQLVDVREAKKALDKITAHKRLVNQMCFNKTSPHLLATASEDCTVGVFKLDNCHLTFQQRNEDHTDYVRGLCWLPDSIKLISCGWDNQVLTTNCDVITEHNLEMDTKENAE